MRQTARRDPYFPPTMNGGDGGFYELSDGAGAAESVDDFVGIGFHATQYAIIANKSQDKSCDNRFCDIRTFPRQWAMDQLALNAILDERNIKSVDLATMLGISEDKVSKSRAKPPSKRRQWQAGEFVKLLAYVEGGNDSSRDPDLPSQYAETEYVQIEVLPTFGGAGGGGTGDGDREFSLVPRALIVDVLRGSPGNFLLINVRGDSMEPDFRHGDQILIDRRDTSPAQPGPFALWDGDWGEYVVKNVERDRGGDFRIFSSNPKYQATIVESEHTRIIGRPVWFGRRL